MKVIVGLGNPGLEYRGTRHNIGFEVIDELAKKYNIDIDNLKHQGLLGKGQVAGEKVVLVKPQTYMNNSGQCVRAVMDYYKLDSEDLLVVYDDISLETGRLRVRGKGSAGGHNGVKSIISHLGSENWARIKFGVGDKPKGWDLADWVLGHFYKEDEEKLLSSQKLAIEAIECVLTEGVMKAQNKYN